MAGSNSKRRKSSKGRKTSKCRSGYVKNRLTGRCVFATGSIGRKLSKKRAAKKRTHRRSGRPSPNTSATLYSIGFRKIGGDKREWKVKRTSHGVKRWVRV